MADNIEIARRFELAFRAGEQATVDELAAPGLVDHNAPPGHDASLAGFTEKVAEMLAIFPDLNEELEEITGAGDVVATRWKLTGSQQQEFMGIPGRGQRIEIEGMNFYRLQNGRVTDVWTQFDGAGMMQQLTTG
jgi:steroid delta-isomerase-like uncharacterized protein